MPTAAQSKAQAILAQGMPRTEKEALALIEKEPEVAVFLLLEQAKRIQTLESQSSSPASPSTPSGMIPPYEKSSTKGKKKKKSGRKKGHKGSSRPTPTRIDQTEEHRLDCCPDCGGPLQRCNSQSSTRTRVVEDIPKKVEPEVTEHILHRDYCPHCKKMVEPKVGDALKNATIGNRLLVLTAYWHFALGLTLSQILDTLNFHLQFRLSAGGLVQKWHTLRLILMIWYETLAEEVQKSAVAHGDETGWRVDGQTHWLWCFTSADTTFYMVDRSRGSPALRKFFQEEFQGILVTDFWAAYDTVLCMGRQCCIPHLLRELDKVDQRNSGEEWRAFAKKVKRLIGDAIRVKTREDFTPERYATRIRKLYERNLDLALASYTDKDARRLAKRLEKYRDELFTFLEHPEVPCSNNHAEREIRPAVQLRKMIYGNRSEKGALTQSVLMSVFRTLRRRGYNPIATLVSALREYSLTDKLPSFPPPITSNN